VGQSKVRLSVNLRSNWTCHIPDGAQQNWRFKADAAPPLRARAGYLWPGSERRSFLPPCCLRRSFSRVVRRQKKFRRLRYIKTEAKKYYSRCGPLTSAIFAIALMKAVDREARNPPNEHNPETQNRLHVQLRGVYTIIARLEGAIGCSNSVAIPDVSCGQRRSLVESLQRVTQHPVISYCKYATSVRRLRRTQQCRLGQSSYSLDARGFWALTCSFTSSTNWYIHHIPFFVHTTTSAHTSYHVSNLTRIFYSGPDLTHLDWRWDEGSMWASRVNAEGCAENAQNHDVASWWVCTLLDGRHARRLPRTGSGIGVGGAASSRIAIRDCESTRLTPRVVPGWHDGMVHRAGYIRQIKIERGTFGKTGARQARPNIRAQSIRLCRCSDVGVCFVSGDIAPMLRW